MKLKVPKKIEFYLSKIYGKGYKKKPINWNNTNIRI